MGETSGAGQPRTRKRIVIVGGGFAGLVCSRQLGNSDNDVVVVARRNHSPFKPLLYQVATAALSPADIREPIRRTLGQFRNISVVLSEGIGTDTTRKL